MYFWNVQKLAEELKTQQLTEYEKMKYLLFFTLMMVIGSSCMAEIIRTPAQALFDLGGLIAGLLITTFGILNCFWVNQMGDNKNFIERITCLGLPISIRIVLIFFLIYTPIAFTIATTSQPYMQRWALNFVGRILGLALDITYYIWLRYWIRQVAVN